MALARYFKKYGIEAGCDEAGRGCLAGPVFAAAVILPKTFSHPLLNDSKQCNEEERTFLKALIEKEALSFAVSSMTPNQIDRFNILRASINSMHLALSKLTIIPERILVDGNKFYPYNDIEYHTIIKGDAKYTSIAAASILAKTYRDEYMVKMDKKYPGYNFRQNKGYPTLEHRQAIMEIGVCKIHRKSFRLLSDSVQLSLFD